MRKDISIQVPRAAARGLLLLQLLLLSGCETVGYYSQAVTGQLALTFSRQPVATLVTDPTTPASLRQRLEVTQSLLSYIERELGLTVAGRYRTYVALKDDAVLYNLVATPSFSVAAHRWCYPVAGCAPYRGYFKRKAALAAAERYRRRGFTIYVGSVPAYSTLGWFKDPLLSSFIDWNEPELLSLLAHELAHSRAWVDSDVAFNEAFASFVGDQSARNWLASQAPGSLAQFTARRAAWQQMVQLQLQLKARLSTAYALEAPDAHKAQSRDRLYQQFRDCYTQHKASLGAGRYDNYVSGLNDAALAALATYRDDVPAFAALYRQVQGRWDSFFAGVDQLATLSKDERQTALRQLLASSEQEITQRADDERAEQVQCQAFADHPLNGH